MKKFFLTLLLGILLPGLGFTGIKSYHLKTDTDNEWKSLLKEKSYQIRVNTGDPMMNILLYEFSLAQFQKIMNIKEQGSVDGSIDILFATVTEGTLISNKVSSSHTYGQANVWYNGSGNISETGNINMNGRTQVMGKSTRVTNSTETASMLNWQNSTMVVMIKDLKGQRIWTADYRYNGGLAMSGYVVNTPEEAARHCIKKLAERLKMDLKRNKKI